jgi:hypothetical protein
LLIRNDFALSGTIFDMIENMYVGSGLRQRNEAGLKKIEAELNSVPIEMLQNMLPQLPAESSSSDTLPTTTTPTENSFQ